MVNLKPARVALCVGLLCSAQFAGAHLGLVSNANAQDSAADNYAAVLEQIQNVRLATQQREVMLLSQDATEDSLREQIAGLPETKDAVRGIVTKMVAEIAKVIETDLPFRKEEREARLTRMQDELADKSARPVDLFRRAMTLYDIEANYGYSISAYTGNNPKSTERRRLTACRQDLESPTCNLSKDLKDKLSSGFNIEGTPGDPADISHEIMDGNYVHFGRMSFIYLDLDSREGFRWSKEAGDWEPLSSGDILNARRSVRIARGESAPGVVTAPIKIQAAQ